MHYQFTTVPMDTVFEQVNTLPGSEEQPVATDGNIERRRGQRASDMGRHIVGSFALVPVKRVALRNQPGEEIVEIGKNIGIGIFLNQQRRRRMAAEQRQQPGLHGLCPYPAGDLSRHIVKPLSIGLDLEPCLLLILSAGHCRNLRHRSLPNQRNRTIKVNSLHLPILEHKMNKMASNTQHQEAESIGVAAEITRGVCRFLRDLGYSPLTEFRVGDRRRVDVIGVNRAGKFLVVEVKSSVQDYKSDQKWPEYIAHGDKFYFAVDREFPLDILPPDCGIMIADSYGATVVREARDQPVHATRRKAQTLRFAKAAADRLQRLSDPRVSGTRETRLS